VSCSPASKMFLFIGVTPLSMIFIIFIALAALPNSMSFVHDVSNNSRRRCAIGELHLASSIDQLKLDFIGSLDNAYDLNPQNPASTSFLGNLVEQATPETISRQMVESFEQLSAGKWRIVYVQDFSTSFGFGSLFGDISAGEVDIGYDGSIISNIQCSNPSSYELTFEGTFGTARNNMLIKVNNIQPKKVQREMNGGLLSELNGRTLSIRRSILEKNWQTIFSGVLIVDLSFIDDNLAIFDIDFLARMKGRRICARKEPDFF